MTPRPLAHSSPDGVRDPHYYGDHVREAVAGAGSNAEAVAAFIPDQRRARRFIAAVLDGAAYHDLGKLDPDNQAGLRIGRNGRLLWDHVDAGVAYLTGVGAETAAWIVRSHHAPGLPARAAEFNPLEPNARRLRGGRTPGQDPDRADELVARNDRTIPALLTAHMATAGTPSPARHPVRHGMFMRLALSCLVDADHADAAWYEHGRAPPKAQPPCWEKRLERLDAYVAGLAKDGARQADREAFYAACRHGGTGAAMVACAGPVGIGKTTAVAAWCLRRAIASGARRIFVVAPYTTILSQTAATLRQALLLPGEDARADEIVAEHHHRADFRAIESRDLATLWRAPIIVTTGVQFFETLAACDPGRLRKLHSLPGSVVFLDEAHATLSAPLWRQNWLWMRELAQDWGCSFVLASGSLARVWEEPDIVGAEEVTKLPDLVPQDLASRLIEAESARVRYRTLGRVQEPVWAILERPGPRLAIFNTVQTAAVIASRMREAGADVLHLSTALCPFDRELVLEEVKRRLDPKMQYGCEWTLVATSLVEAGVDLSFRSALRERFSTASLIQVGGRANRHGGGYAGEVFDLLLDADNGITTHPGAARSAAVLGRFLDAGMLGGIVDPAALVTRALREELRDSHGATGAPLAKAEKDRDYPKVAELGRLIATDTVLVVVDRKLRCKMIRGEFVTARDFLAGSVQIWSNKIAALGLESLKRRPEVHLWPHAYDSAFLGYMAGVLRMRSGEAFII